VFFKYSGFIEQKSKAMLIYDMVDFHYLRLKRKWEQNKNKTLEKKVDKYLNIETHCCKKAKKIITISEDDKEELLKYYSNASKMLTISNIHQHKATRINCFEKRKDLLFVGGFSHTPNVDAVKYLHDEIMPLVWKQDKNIKINIIGSYPTEEVKKLNSEKFNILGFVEDLEPFYRKSRLFVAPLRYGAGVKGKIGQSLEYSLPVITTSIGAEGFDFGKHKDVMVSDDKMQLVDNILNLYTKANLWQSVSGATSNILEPFSLEETEKKILEVLS
jgi:glycosyltransferase involved in cell wall biosynthesis